MSRQLWTAIAAAALGAAGCTGREPGAEAKLERALQAQQQGRLEEAFRQLAAIRPGGGWLRPAAWGAPLALRLRADLALRLGAREEAERLLGEYAARHAGLAPAAYARSRLAFLERYRDAGGMPAVLYLRGLEAAGETPAVALREWRTLIRDYPRCALAPAAQLKLGRLQQRLGNAAWAIAELSAAAQSPPEALDPDGNPVAPQALLAQAATRRELMMDPAGARADFEAVIARFASVVLRTPEGLAWSPASLARYELAVMELDGGGSGVAALEALAAGSGPAVGFVSDELTGDLRVTALLTLAEAGLKRRSFARVRERLVEAAKTAPDAPMGPPDGPQRWCGYEAVDRLADRLGARAPDEALQGLAELAAAARRKELWAYAQLARVRLLARMGRLPEARDALADLERRFPSLDCDARGDGLSVVPAREARRILGS